MSQKTTKDLSICEVGEVLGISKKTVLEIIKRGELPAYRPGLRAYRVTQKALDDFREKRRVLSF